VHFVNDPLGTFGSFVIDSDSLRNGKYEEYYSANKNLKEQSTYHHGKLEGLRKLYDGNGKLKTVESYKNGSFEGKYQTFHASGNLESEGIYANNSMTGIWKFYYPNKQLKEEVNFKDNNENGPFKEFYGNGKIKAEGQYLGGDFEEGPLMLYDTFGVLMRKMVCSHGACHTIWVDSTRIKNVPNE